MIQTRPFAIGVLRYPSDAEMEDAAKRITARIMAAIEPDPLLTDLARLLDDPRVPDAYAESVRAQLHEMVYQLKAVTEGVVVKEQAA